jgi:hypothetical protein
LPNTSNQRFIPGIAKRDTKFTLDSKLKHLMEGKCVLQSKYTEEGKVIKTRKQNIPWRLIAKIRRERHFILS